EALQKSGFAPHDLLQPANEPRFRLVYDRYLDMAEGHLVAGWAYTNLVPRRCMRVRLACAWPLLIGRETLRLLRTAHFLDPSHRIKITRGQVRNIIWRSVLSYPWPKAWQNLFHVNRGFMPGFSVHPRG